MDEKRVMKAHIEIFAPETGKQSEWRLAGWAFLPGGRIERGRWELSDGTSGPLSCGWPRSALLLASPADDAPEDIGFRAQVILPPGLESGAHELTLVFLNERNEEVGRAVQAFSLKKALGASSRPGRPSPRVWKDHPQSAYLDLLEKTLLGLPYAEAGETMARSDGRDWPRFGHSMIGMTRLRHLRACAETALVDCVPGDFVETGVWRGGACILLRGVLRAYSDQTRKVWVVDSFAGLPEPNPAKYPADTGDTLFSCKELAIPLEQVRENFDRYDLLDGQVKFLQGWFSHTLPEAPIREVAVLRLDGDMYESTMDALTHLYPKLSTGGFCIIDDYGCVPACRKAVRDYRRSIGITEPMTMIDWTGAFWRKD